MNSKGHGMARPRLRKLGGVNSIRHPHSASPAPTPPPPANGMRSRRSHRQWLAPLGAAALLASLLVAAPAVQAQLGVPGLFAGTQTPTSIIVNWSITDPNIKVVRLEQSDDGGNSWTLVAQVVSTTTSRNVTGLTPGTAYQFRVQGCDQNAANCGSWSPGLGVSTQAAVKPGTPTLSGSAGSSDSEVDLSWTKPSGGTGGLTGYDYEHRPIGQSWGCSVSGCGSGEVTDTASNPVEDTIGSLPWNQVHEFRVRAKNAHTESGWSNVVKVAGRPSGLSTPSVSAPKQDVRVVLGLLVPTSDGGKPITGYRVEWREDATGNWSDHPATGGRDFPAGRPSAVLTDANDGLEPGVTYNFRYRVSNEDRASFWTPGDGSVSATTANVTNVSIADASAEEGDPLTFAVSLERVWTVDVAVNWQVYDATPEATNGADFTAGGGTVTIPAGQTSKTITVNTIEDTRDESDERFQVRLAAPSGGLPANVKFGDATSYGTITDNDTAAGAPTGLSASATEATIRLAWLAPSPGVLNGAPASISGYQYRMATSTGELPAAAWIDTGSVNTSHDVTVGAAGTYWFQVRALTQVSDADGNPGGAHSTTASAQVTIAATIAGTDPSPLRERTLDGARLTVDLVGTQYESSLSPGQFSLVPGVSGLSVESVNRVSDRRAVLTLAFSGDIASNVDLRIAVDGSAHAASGSLTTGTVGVTQERTPGRVTGVRATAEPGGFTVTWARVNGADGYEVVWHTANQFHNAPHRQAVGGGSTTRATVSGQAGETHYHVWLVATNDFAPDGPASREVSTTTLPADADVTATDPSPLTENNLGGARLRVDLIRGTWAQALSEDQFMPSGVPEVSVASVSRVSNTRAWVTLSYDLDDPATDFDRDATLRLDIAAAAHSGPDEISAVAAVRAVVEPPPGQVDNVALEPGARRIEVDWDRVDGATGYRVRWSPGNVRGFSSAAPRGAGTRYTIGSLAPGTEYTVTVTALKARAPDGAPSAPRSAATPAFRVRLSATEPSRLTEQSLGRAVLTVDLEGAEWRDVRTSGHLFRLSGVPGVFRDSSRPTIRIGGGAERVSPTRVQVCLGYNGADFDTDATLRLEIDEAAHTWTETRTVTAPVTANVEPTPNRATGVTARGLPGGVRVEWNWAANADGHKVQWKSGDQGWSTSRQVAVRGAGWTIGGLEAGTEYTVRVIAFTVKGNPADAPAPHPEATATPSEAPDPPPGPGPTGSTGGGGPTGGGPTGGSPTGGAGPSGSGGGGGPFADVPASSTHASAIAAIARAGITQGCDTARNLYCPDQPVTRAQMATFLARALNLPPGSQDYFTDDNGSSHETNINALRRAGITQGCNSEGTRYCPDQPVTRAQMATFLARALNLI